MIYTTKDLRGLSLLALDGTIGEVTDIFFDDLVWKVRYFVVDVAKSWIEERSVLISPAAVKAPHAVSGAIDSNLSIEQIRSSPPIATELPVSRQYEEALHRHFGWTPYWGIQAFNPVLGVSPLSPHIQWEALSEDMKVRLERDKSGNPHLRSCEEVAGYRIHASDGHIGDVEDFLINSEDWSIDALIVDTHPWLPGGQVRLPKEAVDEVDWGKHEIRVSLSKAQIKAEPQSKETPSPSHA